MNENEFKSTNCSLGFKPCMVGRVIIKSKKVTNQLII